MAIVAGGTNAITVNSTAIAVANTFSVGGNYINPASTGMKNRLINGGMDVWQRGTSFSGIVYSSDRWLLNGSGSLVGVQSTDVPAGFKYSLSCSNTSTTAIGISQRIESINSFDLSGKTVTVSFWFKRTGATGNLQVNLDYPTAIDNYTTTTNIAATPISSSPSTSWTYYTITFNNLTSNVTNGLMVSIFSTNGTNASLGGLFTGVQLEVGNVATPFERRPFGMELALCQRYFCKSYNTETAPGTASTPGISVTRYASTGTYTEIPINIRFPVTMRATPTGKSYSPYNGAVNNIFNADTSTNVSGSIGAELGASGLTITTNAVAGSANQRLWAHWTAEVEL